MLSHQSRSMKALRTGITTILELQLFGCSKVFCSAIITEICLNPLVVRRVAQTRNITKKIGTTHTWKYVIKTHIRSLSIRDYCGKKKQGKCGGLHGIRSWWWTKRVARQTRKYHINIFKSWKWSLVGFDWHSGRGGTSHLTMGLFVTSTAAWNGVIELLWGSAQSWRSAKVFNVSKYNFSARRSRLRMGCVLEADNATTWLCLMPAEPRQN